MTAREDQLENAFDNLLFDCTRAETQLAAARAQIAAALALHPLREKPSDWNEQYTFIDWCERCREPYPCATRRALSVRETP
jgi:hypothetical protein